MTAADALYTLSPSNDSTLAIEVFKTGWLRRKKHILFFERFNGTLHYSADEPQRSSIEMLIDARSVLCRDAWLRRKQQEQVTQYARHEALEADRYPDIRFSSARIGAKELRGFVVEGELKIRGISRIVKVNVVLSPLKRDRFQVDGDVTLCLSDFGIKPPSRLLGLIGTKDQALVRLLLWATPAP
ncbi:MAG: YceI family protein [Acidobacteriaceae bacterium]|nr:YceI family protein [Acidobacteriaceae bacterium]MBV9611895.1 YceI family protein [Acidobacteriaceae bacterium]